MTTRRFRRLSMLLALVGLPIGARLARSDEPPGPTRAAGTASATPTLPALLDRASTPAQRAERAFLEHLGWRFESDPAASKIIVVGGTPCRRSDLASAQAAGDLRIRVPAAVTSEELARFVGTLPEVTDSVASRCAWQLLVAPAADRAIRRLSENEARGFWTFPHWALWNAPVFSMDPPRSQWVRKGRIVQAREKPSAAIEAFYTERASTECYVGQALAAYAIQYELYGPRWFDEVFAPDEIALGQVQYFHETPLGRSMNVSEDYPWRALFFRPSDAEEDPGVVLGRLGPLAFTGLTGILMDQNGTGLSNENFTFASVSAAAVEVLVKNGGFAFIAERTQELLALERATHTLFVTGPDLTANRKEVNRLLSNPVFRGILLHIHPYGVVPLGEIVDRMRRRDRVALEVVLYKEAREDTFFQRYREAWKARWRRAAAGR